MSFLRRRESSSSHGTRSSPAAVGAEECTRWPALAEFLGSSVWSDGETRETGTLFLFLEGDRMKACLSDRAQNHVAFVTGSGLLDVLDVADRGLRTDSMDWREKKDPPRTRK